MIPYLLKYVNKTNKMLKLKKIESPSCNVCDSVEFILRGARKRRNMAIASAKMINADAGIQARQQVVK